MKKISILILLFMGLLAIQIPTQGSINESSINANNFVQLISKTSQYVRIEGEICGSEISNNSKVIFLNFGKNFNTSLSAVIYNIDIPAFIDAGIYEPDQYFKNKKVMIEGIMRITNGKPEIILSSPNQITIVEN